MGVNIYINYKESKRYAKKGDYEMKNNVQGNPAASLRNIVVKFTCMCGDAFQGMARTIRGAVRDSDSAYAAHAKSKKHQDFVQDVHKQ